MVKFLIGLVTGVLLVFLSIVLLFFALLRFREKPPEIANNSVLVMRLSGDVPERAPVELPDFLGGGEALTITDVWRELKMAAADSRIKAAVVYPSSLSVGWAKSEEIRSDLEQFRKSGKPIYAYLRGPEAHDYYVALPADKIFIEPEDPLLLKGMRAELTFYKKTLDKIGVSVDVTHAGKYKDFGDMFTRTEMSPETREQIGAVVDGLYGNLVDRIAAARKMTPDQVRQLIDAGPYTASNAKKAGLVDELKFEDEMWSALKDKVGGSIVRVSAAKYAKVPPESAGLKQGSHVAILAAEGDIIEGSPSDDGTEAGSITAYGLIKQLKLIEGDSNIKAVVIRINSPGGAVNASDDLWRQMSLLSKKKPVVISMSDVAASGGYYMALTGDPLVSYPETETGSIGVVFVKPNIKGLYEKIGITKDGLQRGKHADIESEYIEMTPEERKILTDGIDESYHDFVTKVADSRHAKYEDIDAVAQGRVWLGSDAKTHNLVDQLGGMDTAIALVKKKAGIPDSENVTIFSYPPQESLLTMLTKRSQETMFETRIHEVVGRMPFHAWMQGGYLRMLPLWFEVK